MGWGCEVGKSEGKGPFGNLGVNGRMIFEGILNNLDGWTLKIVSTLVQGQIAVFFNAIMNRRIP